MMKITNSFLWGVATSSYQVEGGITNSDWSLFTTSEEIKNRISSLTKPSIFYKGRGQVHLQPAGKGVRFWDPKFYVEDFEIARRLGMNSFRISLEWSRIEPEKGQWNDDAIDHYKEMIRSMREKKLTPVVTLNHFTLPLWVLTPPSRFKKIIGQHLLPSPLRDAPVGEPPSIDPYWNSLRGWENYQTVEEFIKFVTRVVQELKDQVDFWITLNEPVASNIGVGYIAGLSPPGFFLDGHRAKLVLHNLIEAHVRAYNKITALDDIDADGDGFPNRVGFAHLMMAVSPAKTTKILGVTIKDNTEAAKNFDYFINDYFINAVIDGEEDLNYLNTLQRHNKDSRDFIVHDNWKNKVDFIGLNYYRRVYIYYSPIVAFSSARFVGGALVDDLHIQDKKKNRYHPNHILNDLGWEIYPEGLYQSIMHVKNQWNKPVFITENGVADKSDRYRAQFIVAHVQQIKRAIDDGADVIGYLHWSLMDNYEWQEGYRPEAKFGLFRIDRNRNNNGQQKQQPDFTRHITKGAEAFKIIVEESLNQSKNGVVSNSAILKAKEKFGIVMADSSNIT
jgi:beta-glucosidase/6-phospho-beta-glucosidase/beta-galactosidase